MAPRPVLSCLVGLGVALAWPAMAGAAPAAVRDYDGPADVAADPDAPEPTPNAVATSDGDPHGGEPGIEPESEPDPVEPDPVEPDPLDGQPDPVEAGNTTKPPGPWLPRHRLIYRNFTAGRINPLGLVNETTLGYRLQVVARDTPAFLDSFLLAGAHFFVTPAYVRVGPTVEFQPVAVLNLGVTYDFVGAFGSFGQVQSFTSATDPWGPDDLKRNVEANRNYDTWGHLVTLSAMLQAKVRRVAVRSGTRALWSDMRLRSGDPVYYDQALDILMPNGGWALINETDVIYLFDMGLRLLARHSLTHAFYRRGDFLPGEPVSQPNGPTSRLGPAVAFTFFDRPGVRFNRPTVFLLSQWWLRHRWRTGEQLHPAIPYLALGFAFEGDIVPHRKDTARKRRRR